MDGKTIVVAEGNAAVARLMRDGLSTVAGWRAAALPDGRGAADALAALGADLGVLDVALPGVGGVAVAEELRRHPETAAIPVLFTDAWDYREELRHGGDDECLDRAFGLRELHAAATRLLRRQGERPRGHSEPAA
jgi:DNA-binding response OmpR family regulator